MNFFKTLSEIGITDVIIQFANDQDGQATIFVAPKTISQNNPLKSLNPIFFSGSPEDVDAEFFLKLSAHLVQAKELNDIALSKAKQIKALADAQPKEEKFPVVDNSVEAITARETIEEVIPQVIGVGSQMLVSEEQLQEQQAEEEAERQFEADALLLDGKVIVSTEEMEAERVYEAEATLAVVRDEEELEPKNWEDTDPAIKAEPTHSIEEVRKVRTEKLKTEKVVKVNNEKVLKDFVATIKDKNILDYESTLEEMFAKLSEEEMNKPLYKKVRIDLDIAIRKKKNYEAAKEKFGFKTKENVVVENVEVLEDNVAESCIEKQEINGTQIPEEMVEYLNKDLETTIDRTLEQIEKTEEQSPNVIVATTAGHVEEASIIEEAEIIMIAKDFTLEQYLSVGWTKESLVDAGRAKYVEKIPLPPTPPPAPIPMPPVTKKLGYTFPTPFDAPDGGTGHGDESYSDTDSGL